MYRVMLQTGKQHIEMIEGSYTVCSEYFDSYPSNGTGILYMQRRIKDNHCDSDVYNLLQEQ